MSFNISSVNNSLVGNLQQPPSFWKNGPAPGQFYNFVGNPNFAGNDIGRQRTSQPITTGTSVVGIRFDGGVMIAADNLISYGSLARYQETVRIFRINKKTIIGAGGDFGDWQNIKRTIDQKIIEDLWYEDGVEMSPKSLATWLTRIQYARRSRMSPLWLDLVVGGINDDGEPYLSHVDMRGRSYEDNFICTGLGKHLALPLARELIKDDKKLLTQEEASEVLRKIMEVLYYRDCRALSKYSVAVCTKTASVIEGPFNVNENWELATMVQGY